LREAVARVLGTKEQEGAIPLITRHSLPGSQKPSASLRILLAEDNLVNQRLAMRLLEKRGHSVVVAGNGRETFAAFESGGFDLILMDLQMPEMDGFEATAAIRDRDREGGNRISIVALTAHAMKGDREKCLAAGMDGYLTKPIRPQELDGLLEFYVARQKSAEKELERILSKS
jgi:CheY-like chemotaxis protein